MAIADPQYVSLEEYYELDQASETRLEYYRGQVFAMAGGTVDHAVIGTNIASVLRSAVKGKNCRVAQSDLRVRVSNTGLHTYPDIVMVCGKAQMAGDIPDTIENPVLIVEVLSNSTERYDRGRKYARYRSIPSLMHYILIDQETAEVEHFERQSDGSWLMRETYGLSSVFRIHSLGIEIPMAEIYAGIEFEDEEGLYIAELRAQYEISEPAGRV
jgi:Uma2 family endonuclease